MPQAVNGRERPQWDGTPMDEKLLLIADQGYGDVIQFSRFLPWAARSCRDIEIACAREMHPIVAQILPGVRLFDRWQEAPDFAAYCSFSGLPKRFGLTLRNIPTKPAYLNADPALVCAWKARIDALAPPGYLRVGIAWAGRPSHNNDFNRTTTLASFAEIAELPGVALVALQKGAAQNQVGRYFGRAPLLNLGPEIQSYTDTMAVLECLDLVVSVDTSLVHLAGALGRDALVMLPFAPDWRWLLDRTDTPWYPSVRLFRQPVPRQWGPVTQSIAGVIHQWRHRG
jgi:hypothetical protein